MSKGAASKFGGGVRDHRTLCTGILYVIAISAVLVIVARL